MITEPVHAEDHVDVRNVVRDFTQSTFTSERVRAAAATASGYDELAWKHMIELGWTGLGVAEDAGGAGLGVFVKCIVHRELGARLAPTPYLGTSFAIASLGLLGESERSREMLGGIANGMSTAALIVGHGRGWPQSRSCRITVDRSESGWALTGSANRVLDLAFADTAIVIAECGPGSWGLFAAATDGRGVEIVDVPTVDGTRRRADVTFAATPAEALHGEALDAASVSQLVDLMSVYLAAEMVGAAVAGMNRTLEYLKTRQQFGKPIGSFQALKHRCADTAVAITTAQELVFAAADIADAGGPSALALAAPLALARAGEVFLHAAEEGIQMHGGVGFTDEMDIGLYYKRALGDQESVASPVDAYARMDHVRSGR